MKNLHKITISLVNTPIITGLSRNISLCININNISFIVNPYAIKSVNSSQEYDNLDIRWMVREEFICIFMEATQIGMEAACKDFRILNMYLLANSDALHDLVRVISLSYKVLTLECCSVTRANSHLWFSIVPINVIDITKKSVFYKLSVPFDECELDPAAYSINRHPRWMP